MMGSLLGRRAHLAAVAGLMASVITIPGQSAQAAPGDFTISSTNLVFGDVFLGEMRRRQIVITNVSGGPKRPQVSGGGLVLDPEFDGVQNCTAEIPAGGTCAFSYTFAPQDLGASSASTRLFLEGQEYPVSLSGTGVVPFTLGSTSLDFGDVFVGETRQRRILITNISGGPKTPQVSGGGLVLDPEFDGVQNCTAAVPAGGTCAFSYTFSPQDLGASSASTTLFFYGQSHPVRLTGNGAAPFTLSSTSLDFGNVVIGATVERKVILTNISGTAKQPQAGGGGIAPGNPEFDAVQNCAQQIAPNATCAFTYSFSPADLGVSSTSTVISLYDRDHPVTLTGTGVNRQPITLTTKATSEVALGAPISDKATLEGGVDPTGAITFKVYGPGDATCAGPVVFTSTVDVDGAGEYESGPFTPTAAGTYRWIAEYGGDVNNHPVSGSCNDSGETSVVTAGGGGGGLPVTGPAALRLAGLGVLAIALGGLALYTTRRRRMTTV